MTGTQLARRLGVAQSVASNSEKSERNGSISLKTLSRAAGALGCELRYVLVLRDESLRKTLEKRATAIALSERNSIAQHMRLENQSPDTEIDLAFEAAWLIAHNDRRLWD
jgi:transcriptional regulator with XRE-family HTH domain